MCLMSGCPPVTRRTVVLSAAALPAAAACAPFPTSSSEEIEQRDFTFVRDGATIDGFVAIPKQPANALLTVMHGNAGLPDDVKDTAVWAASLGYVGLAVNPTSRYPDPTKIPQADLLGTMYGERYVDDTRAAIAHLRAEKVAAGKRVGLFGYCGGGYVGYMWGASPNGNELAAMIGAHVAFRPLRSNAQNYRRPDAADLYRKTNLPVQLHQGGGDEFTPPQDITEQREIAREMHKVLELYVYPGAEHGFPMFTQSTYRPEYAQLVRTRAAKFLKRHLG
jgi:dienelactone hydrolase